MNINRAPSNRQRRNIATQEGRMDKNEKQVLWDLIKLRRAVLKKEPDPAKKRILKGWIRDGLRQMRVQKRARKRVFAHVRRGKGQIG